MKLLPHQARELPGITGVARVSRRSEALLGRLSDGDVAVIDHIDLDRATADAMVNSGVAAVVNAAPSISGRYPNLGPEILLASGVILIDDVGEKVFSRLKDGAKVRIDGGAVHHGDELVAEGIEQTPESVADLLIDAKAGMAAQLEAFAANAIEYMKRERTLLLDGVGIPELTTKIAGRHALVVAASAETRAQLRSLRKYISDHHPVLIGVDGGADALRQAGHKPHLIIGNPEHIDPDTLRSGAEVVIPADVDGHAPGLERLQDLGLGAVTFPATGTSEDLALLLADASHADLIVTVGMRATLTDLLDHKGGAASTFLVRMRVANKIVEAPAVALLYRARISWWVVMLLVIAAAAAIVGALLISDVSHTYIDLAHQWWNDVVDWTKGIVR